MKPLLFFIALLLLFACQPKKIPSEKGAIDILSNVYVNASKDLKNVRTFHVSKLNYQGDLLFEIIPDLDFPEVDRTSFLIKDSTYYELGLPENAQKLIISEIPKHYTTQNVYEKNQGTIFSRENIPGYENRKNISDTVLFDKNYQRFEIETPEAFTRYYIYKADTILPYSISRRVEKDYQGRIERIDSYQKTQDVFVTVQLLCRAHWDEAAKAFFEYNMFIQENQK